MGLDRYRDTRKYTRKQDAVTAALRRATRGLTKRQRADAWERAATMPIGERQELAHAVVGERCAPAVAEALGVGT